MTTRPDTMRAMVLMGHCGREQSAWRADEVGRVVALGANADSALTDRRVMVDVWMGDGSDPDKKKKAGYVGSETDGGFAEYRRADRRDLAIVESDPSDAELATLQCSHSAAEGMLRRAPRSAQALPARPDLHRCDRGSARGFRHSDGLHQQGKVTPMLAATYPLEQLRTAQQAFIDKRHTGTIVVLP